MRPNNKSPSKFYMVLKQRHFRRIEQNKSKSEKACDTEDTYHDVQDKDTTSINYSYQFADQTGPESWSTTWPIRDDVKTVANTGTTVRKDERRYENVCLSNSNQAETSTEKSEQTEEDGTGVLMFNSNLKSPDIRDLETVPAKARLYNYETQGSSDNLYTPRLLVQGKEFPGSKRIFKVERHVKREEGFDDKFASIEKRRAGVNHSHLDETL